MSNPEPVIAGCDEWPVVWPCDVTGVDAPLLAAAFNGAVSLLWSYGGRSVGVCAYHEQYWPPCTGGCVGPWKSSDGAWHNAAGRDCCRVLLAHQPVESIVSVSVDGVLLDPDAYVADGAWLRRRGACWSCAGDCDDPPLAVVYRAGFPLPATTGYAVGEVGCELLAAMRGDTCRLPSRAISITRQGVTVQLADGADLAKRRRLGLVLADAWLELVNPHGLRSMSRVYSPDLARQGR